MSSIDFQNVIKRYGDQEVIHNISASIKQGEFVVIVGPSGCGKSTLLRMVAGLEEISSGAIYIEDHCVNDLEPSKRDIAMVFQNYALYPHMNVFDNMAYGLKIAKLKHAEIKQRVQQVAKILELEDYLQRKPRALSGGQRQRVAMGRAIVREPKVFLFDEPLSNLDAKLRVQTRLEIQKLHHRLGITSLFVTHDQVEAMTLAERMMVFNQGRIEQFATPAEVYAKPASIFVAGFIGSPSMNILHTLPQGIVLPQLNSQKSDTVLGVRPEHLTIHQTTGWEAEVELIELLGAERLIHSKLCQTPYERMIVSIREHQACPKLGDRIYLNADLKHLHFFNPQSHLRIEI